MAIRDNEPPPTGSPNQSAQNNSSSPSSLNASSNKSSSDKKSFQISSPAIIFPKSGGAIRGMGEKFNVNAASGTGSFSIPIATSPGRSNFGPELALSYNSGSGSGPIGLGWSMPVPSVSRKADKGIPRYQDENESDTYILSGAEDLVPQLELNQGEWSQEFHNAEDEGEEFKVHRYRPRIDGLFARIERWTSRESGEIHWRSISKENIKSIYGRSSKSRISDPNNSKRKIFSWLLDETSDAKGNIIRYEYKAEDLVNVSTSLPQEKSRLDKTNPIANQYLKRILYGNQEMFKPDAWKFEVVFDYGDQDEGNPTPEDSFDWPIRQDPFSTFRAGFEVRTYRLCRRVLMFHHFEELGEQPYLVRSTNFEYDHSPILTRLLKINNISYKRNEGGTLGYISKSLPPVEFTYSEAVINEEIQEIDAESLENLPSGLDGASYKITDLDGEGVSGILTEQGGQWFYKQNLGNTKFDFTINPGGVPPPPPSVPETGNASFGPVQAVAVRPGSDSLLANGWQLLDLAGDGKLDVVQLAPPTPGFYERTEDGKWDSFRPFRSVPNLSGQDPNLKWVDIDGDGRADALVTEHEVFTWYSSEGEEGFGPAEKVFQPKDEDNGPAVIFADGTETIFLGDMSGGGLNDIVRIRNGEICYWPNLGYGRFGAKIVMDQAPVFDRFDLFSPKRIRLIDIDGSGTTDVIYLGEQGVDLYFNQAGNSWSEAKALSQFPKIDNFANVQAVDLLGNGTACLVWSSSLPQDKHRPLKYIDLLGGSVPQTEGFQHLPLGGKPHLLISIRDNLGAETRIQYAPSTRFYLEDKLKGTPWITKLPFPVQVVSRVEVFDWTQKTKFVNHYRYHHGFFDGVEREFRGFGMVEQWDTDTFSAFKGKGLFPENPTNAEEEELHQVPVYTKTWFHTGAYFKGKTISHQYAREYWQEDPHFPPNSNEPSNRSDLIPDTILPAGLTPGESQQAARALKGQTLRQEVYGLDDSDASRHPYTVSEQSFNIKLMQPMNDNRHAVFFTHPGETLSFHYERNPEDPRVTHQITLAVDDHGNIIDSVMIGYPRRISASDPLNVSLSEQRELFITYSKSDFINQSNSVDYFFVGVPYQSRTYEVTGINWDWPANPFQWLNKSDFEEIATDPESYQPYEWQRPQQHSDEEKRIVEWSRSYFRQNVEVEEIDLPGDLSHRLPLGDIKSLGLPYETYTLALTDSITESEQAYDGRVTQALLVAGGYHQEQGQPGHWWIPSGKQAFDAERFYLVSDIQDPFGQITHVQYDDHHLLLDEVVDPLGNVVQSVNDYRVLQTERIIDPNGNRSEAAFDILGMITGTAVMGKVDETLGDSLDNFNADLDANTIAGFFDADDPLSLAPSLLGDASTRLIYDVDRYQRTRIFHADGSESGEPPGVATLARETNVSALAEGEETAIQISFLYSDGLDREIQSKVQAEPGPLDLNDPESPIIEPRWVGTGRTVYNNKGNPVKQYEPFFSARHKFESEPELTETGVTPIIHYDPLDREIRTDLPDGTFTKVEFDPWSQSTWDQNDTVLTSRWYAERGSPAPGGPEPTDRSERAAYLAAQHAETPAVLYLDTLGRPFRALADNGPEGMNPTHTRLDIEGNPIEITDARGNRVELNAFDITGRNVRKESMDSGSRWIFMNVAGNPISSWDSRSHRFRMEYDKLQRPKSRFVQTEGEATETLLEFTVYGEDADSPKDRNLLGQAFMQFDAAGMVTSEVFDFKGNPLSSSRRLTLQYKDRVNWQALHGFESEPALVTASAPFLENESFQSSSAYDALNRPTTLISPDSSITRPVYNEANLLEEMYVTLRGSGQETAFITNIDYNARGQRILVEYQNGSNTRYEYDPLTFRLMRLQTHRLSDNALMQDLTYTFDPVGNITDIRDDAQQTLYFNNQIVQPVNQYHYDALYRLNTATGREHVGQNVVDPAPHRSENKPNYDSNDSTRRNLPHPADVQAMRNYQQVYGYDDVGNILKMQHSASNGSWTQDYDYETANNRLHRTRLPDDQAGPRFGEYTHDNHGNMTAMPHLADIKWDVDDQMQNCDLDGGGTVYYVYDSAGKRVKKIRETAGATMEERIYLDGYEVFRRTQNGAPTTERQILHVMDDVRRIALVETLTVDAGNEIQNATSMQRFQFDNHLGSASLELDESAQLISYEEYCPYGSTSFHTTPSGTEVSDKRYRYTGKERDEETGLYYHGARYYAPWLARWTAADPAGLVDGVNLYRYVSNRPVVLHDPSGGAEKSVWDTFKPGGGVFEAVDNFVNPNKEDHPALGAVMDNLAKRGEGIVEGTKQKLKETAEDYADIAYYSTHITEPGALEKVQSAKQRRDLAPLKSALDTVKGFGEMVKRVGEGSADIAYYANSDEPDASAKVANAVTDIVLDAPQIVLAVTGAANLAKGAAGATSKATGAKSGAKGAEARAKEIHSKLDDIAQTRRTTAVTETKQGVRVISSNARRLTPKQRKQLGKNEVEGVGKGHAEVTGVNAAREMGLTPTGTAASRPICPHCAKSLADEGIKALSPLKVVKSSSTTK